MSDQLLFQVSNESQATAEPFIQKSVVYITDQNNGSYSAGQVIIDTSSLSNSGKWASYSEATLQIPIVSVLSPLQNMANTTSFVKYASPFAIGTKNNFANFIHSMSVEYNNTNVVQLCPYSNFYVNYKMLTSMSVEDADKLGPTIGFFKDTCDSWTWTSLASGPKLANNRDMGFEMLWQTSPYPWSTDSNAVDGTVGTELTQVVNGYSPNFDVIPATDSGVAATSTISTTSNFGFYKRQKLIAFQPAAAPYTSLITSGILDTMAFNYFQNYATSVSTNDSKGSKVWRFLATIRLKDLHDFFSQISLVRGAYMRFIINCNLGSTVLTSAADAGSATKPTLLKFTESSTQLTQATMPLMLASADYNQGAYHVSGTAGEKFLLACAIAKINPNSINSLAENTNYAHSFSACRLYCPLYTMNPIAEAAYLEANPTKTIVYKDVLNYLTSAVASGSNVSTLLTNGVVNPKTLIGVPIMNADVSTGNGISPHQSVFTSEPATCSPLAIVNQLNILLAGVTVFQQNIQYSWETYYNELQHQNAINGSQTTGLNSGLISQYDWSQNYGYIIADISRRVGSENAIPKSIQVLFQNQSAKTMDYFFFIEIERSLTISLINGQLVA